MTDFKHIIRIGNTDLDGNKNILFAMNKIKGVGVPFAKMALSLAGIDTDKKAGNLLGSEVKTLNEVVTNPEDNGAPAWMLNRRKDYETGEDKHLLGPDLEFQIQQDIKRMSKTKSYKGLRHQWGLTVRGQRTRSNFRNKSGTLGVNKKRLTE